MFVIEARGGWGWYRNHITKEDVYISKYYTSIIYNRYFNLCELSDLFAELTSCV